MSNTSKFYEITDYSVVDLEQIDMVDVRMDFTDVVCVQFKSGAFRFVFESKDKKASQEVFNKLVRAWRMYHNENKNN